MAQHDEHINQRVLRRQERWAEADAKELDNAINAMLQHKETRRYLYWLLEITQSIHQNPYRGNFGDTAFACGEQNIGNQIVAHLIECAPDGYLALLKEKADERSARQHELAGVKSGSVVDREPTNGNPDA